MPQTMMREAICSNRSARAIERLLTFTDPKNFRTRRLIRPFASHPFKQDASVWNERDAAQFPILSAGHGVAANDDLASFKIHVSPRDLARFTNSTARES